MLSLARFSLRRPVAALAAWIGVAIALGLIGFGIESRLSPSILVVPGSESARAEQIAKDQFGPTQLTPILLQGPKSALDRQGPILVRALRARPSTRVLSAWDPGSASAALRPSSTARMIVVSIDRSEKAVMRDDLPQIEKLVDQRVNAPVTSHITGQASIDAALKSAMIDKTQRAELLALPLLFLVALLALGAPLAALVVTAFGASTLFAGMGAMTVLARVIDTDPTAVAVGSLAALALGVGFSLMVVQRFREERSLGAEPVSCAEACARAVETAGRAVLWGGSALALCLVVAVIIAPTVILGSLGIGVLLCSLLSVGAATVVMPAVLTIGGHRLDVASFPAPAPIAAGWRRLVAGGTAVSRHPLPFGAIGVVALLALAIPALDLGTGPPDVTQLPKSAQARKSFEAVSATMGPGWATPYNIVVSSKDRAITDTKLLHAVKGFEDKIARDSQVASVTGPGTLVGETKDLQKLPKTLDKSKTLLKGGKRDLKRLATGLGQAGAGVQQLRTGMGDAANGAGQLQSGSASAQTGAGQLHSGLTALQSGATKLSVGLSSALSGATTLKKGASDALAGSRQLSSGLDTGAKTVKAGLPAFKQLADTSGAVAGGLGSAKTSMSGVTGQIDAAIAKLSSMTTGKDDPAYQAALGALNDARSAAAGLGTALGGLEPKASTAAGLAKAISAQGTQLSAGLNQLSAGSNALAGGISKLRAGNSELASGLAQLSGGGKQLSGGLAQATGGAGALQAGLAQLTGGAGQLAAGLSSGVGPSGKIVSGLNEAQTKVNKFTGQLPSSKDLEQLQRQAPGLFDSGYFVLAAIDGAPATQREQATFMINLTRGGAAGQILVVPKRAPTDAATRALADRLHDMSGDFAAATHTQVAVGGPAGNLADFTSVSSARLPLVIAGLAVATALLLMVALRSVLAPIVAVAMNLITVAATFGLLTLLFTGDDPLAGGPGYIDAMGIIAVFAAIFGISTAFEVFLLARVRELVRAGESPRDAIRHALRFTAIPLSGTAAAMAVAPLPFLLTDLLSVRQFAIAMIASVLLQALLVRPVVLPAAIGLLGRTAWWPMRMHTPPSTGAGAAPPPRERRFHRLIPQPKS
jgi:RND superfamily putative drug exporter